MKKNCFNKSNCCTAAVFAANGPFIAVSDSYYSHPVTPFVRASRRLILTESQRNRKM